MKKNSMKGFTLIEIMVALAIIGILSSIAWPIYQNYTLKNIRGQAVNMLSQLQHEMERCASNNNGSYVGCDDGVTPGMPLTIVNPIIAREYNDIYYNVAIGITGGGAGYTLTATEVTGNDPDCLTLTIDELGNKGFTEVAGSGSNMVRCWGSN